MSDEQYMKRAMALARRGLGSVEPNPIVGCVIVKDGRVVGEGYHRRFGGPHAEVEALRDAGEAAKGATVYVTLEPCPHFGKTPPCDRALIEAGVRRVVIGRLDPHPERGQVGVQHLKEAGIEVEVVGGGLHEACAGLIEPFVKRTYAGLPYVIAKWAATVDGAIATGRGDSQWISGEASRRIVHQVRGRVDAVVVGIGTAVADDPLLTARPRPRKGGQRKRVARRVVIDPSLRLPVTSKLIATIDEAPLTIATHEQTLKRGGAAVEAMRERGVELLPLPGRKTQPSTLNLEVLMRHLVREHDATNVLVEGGGRTIGTLIEQELVDELMVFIGPKVLGDGGGVRPVVFAEAPGAMNEARNVRLAAMRRIGEDVLLSYRIAGRR